MGSAIVPLDRALLISYRLSVETILLPVTVWPQFAMQIVTGVSDPQSDPLISPSHRGPGACLICGRQKFRNSVKRGIWFYRNSVASWPRAPTNSTATRVKQFFINCIGLPIHCNYQLAHYSGFCRISPSIKILNRFKPNLQVCQKTRLPEFFELLTSSGFRARRRRDFFVTLCVSWRESLECPTLA